MIDIVDKKTRSRMMAGIRGKYTKPEQLVAKFLRKEGIVIRMHEKRLPGTPDVYVPAARIAIQVQGCFWHGHSPCRNFKFPATRKSFWKIKLTGNRKHDRKVRRELERLGVGWIVVWECALRLNPDESMRAMRNSIRRGRRNVELCGSPGVLKIKVAGLRAVWTK